MTLGTLLSGTQVWYLVLKLVSLNHHGSEVIMEEFQRQDQCLAAIAALNRGRPIVPYKWHGVHGVERPGQDFLFCTDEERGGD